MSVGIHQTIPEECTPIKKGTFVRLFDAKCTKILKTYNDAPTHPNPRYKQFVRSARKNLYIAQGHSTQVEICESIRPFAVRGRFLRMDIHRRIKCVVNKVKVQFDYGESTNPSNEVVCDPQILEFNWSNHDVPLHFTIETPSIGDPFEFDSSGIGSADITVSLVDDEPDNTCTDPHVVVTAHLNSLGAPIDFMFGTPIDQSGMEGCGRFSDGEGPSGFWTGGNFAHGPVGLIMNMSWRVTGETV